MCSETDKTQQCAAAAATAATTFTTFTTLAKSNVAVEKESRNHNKRHHRRRQQQGRRNRSNHNISRSWRKCLQSCYQLLLSDHVSHLCGTTRELVSSNSNSYCRPVARSQLLHCMALIVFGLMLWSNCIGSTCAAPQSCILCDKDDLKAKDPSNSYEEFLFEHQVTRQDAINALRALNESFYVGPSPDNSCKSVTCTKKVMKYCLGPQFINDHCWCELGHTDEGLPFVPHICYVGEKVYTASVGSCFFYEEVKECCCAPALAKQWRHISGAARPSRLNVLTLLITNTMLLCIIFIASHSLCNILYF